MLLSNPTGNYISWKGLIITDSDNIPYVIQDGMTYNKFIYWESSNSFKLVCSDVRLKTSLTRFQIYYNDFGDGTEIPNDGITIEYRDGGSSSVSSVILGKFNEIDGKFFSIQENINKISEIIGTTESGGNTLLDRLTKVEKTANGITEEVKTVKKEFNDDKEMNVLKDNLNDSLINTSTSVSKYETDLIKVIKDLNVSENDKIIIKALQDDLKIYTDSLIKYHNELIIKISKNVNSASSIANLNRSKDDLINNINNLNSIINTAISDGSVVPSEITIIINTFGTVGLKLNNYKNVISESIILGIGGTVYENLLKINKTSKEFNQTMSEMVEEIDGETGLKKQVAKNSTAIIQTSTNLELNYTKFDKKTSSLKLGDGFIKLDAKNVLMTGTLTWDSLDDIAKENLKGEPGTSEFIMLIGEQIFKYDKSLTPNIEFIDLNVQISNILNPQLTWLYKNPSNQNWTDIKRGSETSLRVTHNSSMWNGGNSITIRVVCNSSFIDEMTIVKLYDGTDGAIGSNGANAKYVTVSGEQVFKYTSNFQSSPSPTTITLYGSKYNLTSSNTKWYYKHDSSWTELTSYRGFENIVINPNNTNLFGVNNYVTIKYEVETYSDQITIAKISDGANGKDGYYVLLSNENHSVPCNSNGIYTQAELDKAKTTIKAYKGNSEIGFSLSKTDIGCVSSFNTSTKTLSLSSLTDKTALIEMNITVEGNVFKKTMTITKSLQGDKGADGTGINIIGELDDISQLPKNGAPGDAYIIKGLIYVWTENKGGWSDGVPFKGEQGNPGINGSDGRTTYFHIKYSDNGTSFTSNNGETVGSWIGQYTDFYQADSSTFGDYKWKKIKGEDGDNGIVANLTNDTHLIPTNYDGSYDALNDSIFDGCNSKISLSYNGVVIISGVTYSRTSSSGVGGIWDSSTGTITVVSLSTDVGYVDLKAIYNGVTYVKRFTISKNKMGLNGSNGTNGSNGSNGSNGLDGMDAYTINISNDNHSFVADYNGGIVISQSTSTVITAFKGTSSVTPSIGNITSVQGLSISKNRNTINITSNVGYGLAKNGTINIPILIDGYTFNKLFSWSRVDSGKDGYEGSDGYTVILSNENHSFITESDGNVRSEINIPTTVKAYKGTNEITPRIGTISCPLGMSSVVNGSTINIKILVGNNLPPMGSLNILITVDNIPFIKTFSWSKTLKGQNGQDGTNGTDANVPQWIKDWDSNKTQINGTSVITPKIFAGQNVSGNITGVAIGKDVFGNSGTLANTNGIVGYKNNKKMYSFDLNGDVLIGDNTNFIKWNGSEFEVKAKKITLGTSPVATDDSVSNAVDNVNVGVVNLVKDSDFNGSLKDWDLSSGSTIDYEKSLNGSSSLFINQIGNTADVYRGATQVCLKNYKANDKYMISFWYYVENKSTFDDGYLTLEFKGTRVSDGANIGVGSVSISASHIVQGVWTRVSREIYNYSNFTDVSIYPWVKRNGVCWITNIQVVKGNKDTDWKNNPSDAMDRMTDLEKELSYQIEDGKAKLVIDEVNGVSIEVEGTKVEFNTKDDVDTIVTDFNNKFKSLEGENGGFSMIFDKKYKEYGIDGALMTTKDVNNHIDFLDDGSIKLHGSDSPFSLTLEKNQLSFSQGSNKMAWMTTDKLYIKDGQFTSSMQIGKFKWIPRENGNLSFSFVG